jgi:hypothetical protein
VLDPIKLINLAKDTRTEYQLQRIGYILDHIDVMDEPGAEIIINALALHAQENKPSYLPLASEISKIGYSRCKKWRIIENSELLTSGADHYTQVIIDLLQAPRSDVRHIFPRFVTFLP